MLVLEKLMFIFLETSLCCLMTSDTSCSEWKDSTSGSCRTEILFSGVFNFCCSSLIRTWSNYSKANYTIVNTLISRAGRYHYYTYTLDILRCISWVICDWLSTALCLLTTLSITLVISSIALSCANLSSAVKPGVSSETQIDGTVYYYGVPCWYLNQVYCLSEVYLS